MGFFGSESKFESSIKLVPYPQQAVYNNGELKLRICDREEPKCVKFETVESPVPFNVWIQVLPVDEQNSKMKVTVKADLNPFIRSMVEKPLQDGVEKIADALAQVHYI